MSRLPRAFPLGVALAGQFALGRGAAAQRSPGASDPDTLVVWSDSVRLLPGTTVRPRTLRVVASCIGSGAAERCGGSASLLFDSAIVALPRGKSSRAGQQTIRLHVPARVRARVPRVRVTHTVRFTADKDTGATAVVTLRVGTRTVRAALARAEATENRPAPELLTLTETVSRQEAARRVEIVARAERVRRDATAKLMITSYDVQFELPTPAAGRRP
jgi:hypothetical protein